MHQRKILTGLVTVLIGFGFLMASIPFFASLSPTPKAENDAWIICDVSNLKPGEFQDCGNSQIYRRTSLDKEAIDRFKKLLADPASIHSKQPSEARNKWRSVNIDYFIFRPFAPERGCLTKFHEKPEACSSDTGCNNPFYWGPPEAKALESLPYFYEYCEGRTWDMSGRLYNREYYPYEENLAVPKARWLSKTKVQIRDSFFLRDI